MTTVTLLVENTARPMGWLAEHGIAWWIDTGPHRVLFDTGQGLCLRHNAAQAGLDLARADAVVLSHGHADHVGGLEAALEPLPATVPLHLHPRATEPKFSGSGGPPPGRRISLPFVEQERFRQNGRAVRASAAPTEVVPGLWTTGEVPRTNDFEDTGGPFFLDSDLTRPDPLLDDLSVFWEGREGWVVVLGCAHAGVVNILDHIARRTGTRTFHAVLGGMHLERASPHRLRETWETLRRYDVRWLGPCHCTGLAAVHGFWREFPDRCLACHAGWQRVFP